MKHCRKLKVFSILYQILAVSSRILVVFLLTICFILLTARYASASEQVYFLHSDHLGSTTLITKNGEAIDKISYYPYGNERGISNQALVTSHQSLVTEKTFTGQILDITDSGLMYYNARYYNPTLAKFTQADPMGDGLNKYTYTNSNPVNKIDPTGNWVDRPGEFYDWDTKFNPTSYDTFEGKDSLENNYPTSPSTNKVIPLSPMDYGGYAVFNPNSPAYKEFTVKAYLYIAAIAILGPKGIDIVDYGLCAASGGAGGCAATAAIPGVPDIEAFSFVDPNQGDDLIRLYKGMNGYDGGNYLLPGGLVQNSHHPDRLPVGIVDQSFEESVFAHIADITEGSPFQSWTAVLDEAEYFANKGDGIVFSGIFSKKQVLDMKEFYEPRGPNWINNIISKSDLYLAKGEGFNIPVELNFQWAVKGQEYLIYGRVPVSTLEIISSH